jgi:hypothetical protein
MTGSELETFCEEINGGASIGATVLFQFINLAKAMVEQTRPWVALRYTDTSKSVSAGNTWQTAIDLSTIARFNRFYGGAHQGVRRHQWHPDIPPRPLASAARLSQHAWHLRL